MSTEIVCAEQPLTCGECGHVADFLDFDEAAACPGNVFCLDCGAEIDSTTGAKGELCGECPACKQLQEHLEGDQQKSLF